MIDVNAIGAAGLQGVTHAPEQAAIGRADGAAPGHKNSRVGGHLRNRAAEFYQKAGCLGA